MKHAIASASGDVRPALNFTIGLAAGAITAMIMHATGLGWHLLALVKDLIQ